MKVKGKNIALKRVLSLVTVLLTISFVLGGCGLVQVDPEADKNTVVATVYGQDVKKSEFTAMFDIFKYQYEQTYGTDVWQQDVDGRKFIDVAKEKVLDMLIDNKVQLKNAEEKGITVTDTEVDDVIAKARAYFETEEKFNEFLTSQKMTFDYFKESSKTNLIVTKLKEKLTSDITVTDDEMNNYYGSNIDQFYSVKASHILLATEEEAKAMLERVKNGEDFNKLAEQYSIDTTAKDNKGELGYFKKGQMVEEFEKAAFAMKAGQISDPVKTTYGYHIIKVEDVKLDKFEDVKDQIKSDMLTQRIDTAYQKLLDDMRTKANVTKNVKNL